MHALSELPRGNLTYRHTAVFMDIIWGDDLHVTDPLAEQGCHMPVDNTPNAIAGRVALHSWVTRHNPRTRVQIWCTSPARPGVVEAWSMEICPGSQVCWCSWQSGVLLSYVCPDGGRKSKTGERLWWRISPEDFPARQQYWIGRGGVFTTSHNVLLWFFTYWGCWLALLLSPQVW